MKKKKTLTKEEHEEIGESITKFSREFQKHCNLLMMTYGVNSKESKFMHQFLNILTSKLCNELDKRWYNEGISDSHFDNPYYGKGKIAY